MRKSTMAMSMAFWPSSSSAAAPSSASVRRPTPTDFSMAATMARILGLSSTSRTWIELRADIGTPANGDAGDHPADRRAKKSRCSTRRPGGEIFARPGIGLLSLYRPVAQGRQGNGDAADGATHKGAGGQNSELAVAIVQAGRLARVLRNLRAH